jgi:hypothetical protein
MSDTDSDTTADRTDNSHAARIARQLAMLEDEDEDEGGDE